LPSLCQLSGADSAFFLREANQEVMRNGSLSSRTEPFFLHQLEPGIAAPQALPSVNCSYGNLSIEQPIPVELLQGPQPHLLISTNQVTLNWRVKGQVVVPKVGSTRPWIQVLFYLIGRRWDEPDPPLPSLLPCVRALAIRDITEAAPSAGCRLMGPSGICVVRLEIPPAWFTPSQVRRRPPDVTLPPVEVYYSIIPMEGAGQECPSIVNEPWKAQSMSMGSVSAKGEKLQLDENVEVLVPPSPVWVGKTVAFGIYMWTDSNIEQFTLRQSITLTILLCLFRMESPTYEVMQLDFEVDNMIKLVPTQTLHWTVEYLSSVQTSLRQKEKVSHLYISNADIQGIVPLAEDTEVVNTAILTGRRVAVPVKLVTVETDGQVREVDDSVTCSSTDVDVVKVSSNCDQVLVNGREMFGRQSLAVNFTYLHLSAQLLLTVWVPKLPMQIDLSDAELSQVKGWRVPITTNKRPTRDSEDDEDDDRKGKGCTLQYQYALVRVLTHFVTEPSDPGGEIIYMLGPDWQADITPLVSDQLMVGQIHFYICVHKVTITDLGVQLVASLSLRMTASPGNYQAIQLTATATDVLHTTKQEAMFSAWIQYSDGSVTPLDIYDPKDFLLSAVSLDESVVSITNQEQHWPIIVGEGDGQGPLVRVEMAISETCQKSKRKSVLASGVGYVVVKFGANSDERGGSEDGGGLDNSSSRGGGPNQQGDYSSYPAQVEVPGAGNGELTQTTRGLSDLEIGMYALLGVFCLAILVFLINCVSFAFRYRHKQVPVLEAGGNMNHAHDWVWLGNEADLLADHTDQCQGGLPDEFTHGQTLPRSVPEPHQCLSAITTSGKDATGQTEHLNNSPRATAAAAVAAAKRKRVKFTSFATVLPNDNSGGGGAYTNSSVLVTNGNEDDIKWVCQDMDLGQSEIRTYMERLQDNL
uniref:Transmembrane protein 132C-like n=1 Tax=Kryptolebias marmoratus TaxID=37003 RepID=A0A3Q3A053_KRYMA